MQSLPIHDYLPHASRLVYGCMSLGGNWQANGLQNEHIHTARQMIDVCLENGINMFDHADIYSHGLAEAAFGGALKQQSQLRDSMIIQSKCGIRFANGADQKVKRFDFSKDWILNSVDNSLSRLNTDYLDVLFLHRPDPLMQPDEVAEAFSQLKRSGKVKYFAVSNMNAYQIDLLQSACAMPIIANQIEMSMAQLDWLNEGVCANQNSMANIGFNAGTIEHSRLNKIQMQSWGSLAQGLFSGGDKTNSSSIAVQQTAALIAELAAEYQTSVEAIILGFLWRHPMKMQTVVGSLNESRIKACAQVENIELSAEHWYHLFELARGEELP
ncbi:aldo/keto reductase [Catenovulum sp. 2E275]|uniref:aldo/keto reductase n=1 Tax=Catenovulum sp. 2E275 TaxID=2980497 RepID=UPI0021CF66FB|nr:aldo/keto reductase [Catenovulum sp. 2E275]MCU4674869.1 aldo/keto reductase [Catenovulum sp. 2E275]